MLNICIVFAQLERETIQKRVTDAYYSRSQRGFKMGGKAPYGFHTCLLYTSKEITLENLSPVFTLEQEAAKRRELEQQLYEVFRKRCV